MDPCGTPHRKSGDAENLSLILSCNFLLDWYGLRQSITSFENPGENTFFLSKYDL